MNTWKGLNSVSDPLIQTLFRIRVDRFPFQLDNKQSNQIRVERKPFIAGGWGVWPNESEPRRCEARFWFSGQTPTPGYEYLFQTFSRVQFSLATPWQRAWSVERIHLQLERQSVSSLLALRHHLLTKHQIQAQARVQFPSLSLSFSPSLSLSKKKKKKSRQGTVQCPLKRGQERFPKPGSLKTWISRP